MTIDSAIGELLLITSRIIMGDEQAADLLTGFIGKKDIDHEGLLKLAENIGMINVQKEVQTFRLEQIIENLLHAQKEIEEARHDPLTGVPNRALFCDFLTRSFKENENNEQVALMLIDFDRFKQVNDTFGHDAGDEILQLATWRIKSCIKKYDILSRLGGDEFTVILPHIKNSDDVILIAERIIAHIAEPFRLANGVGKIGASIGISFYPRDAKTPLSLLKNADIAMYKAKERGKSRFDFYKRQ